MSWRQEYAGKLVSNEVAAGQVESGDYISIGLCLGGITNNLMDRVLERCESLSDVTIADAVSVWPSKLHNTEYLRSIRERLKYITYFSMKSSRKMIQEKLADFHPVTASDSARKVLTRSSVFMVMVSPPNEEGYVNFGPSNFYNQEVVRRRMEFGVRLVIGEVNERMPIVFGDNWAHISEFDYFVENSTSLIEVPNAVPNEQERLIAQHVLDMIDDGDTLQLGIGAIPEAVAAGLSSKEDIGIFTEMIPSILPELVNKGIVTNRNTVFKPGITVGSFGLGDRAFYEFLDNNPLVELYPSSRIVTPIAMAAQPNMRAINNALLVDLTGQICSEALGYRHISGSGGQPDCHIGAYHAQNGRAFTLITSARNLPNGDISSSIVAELPPGTPVTVGRNFADTVVTEYGVAELRNKSRLERAQALIGIAHPSVREKLAFEAEKMF